MDPTSAHTQTEPPATSGPTNAWRGKHIFRSRTHRMVGGVSGGIAEYFGVDPTIVRLAFVISAFFGGAGIVAYIVAWLIIPEA